VFSCLGPCPILFKANLLRILICQFKNNRSHA
jgi:hypothetical protein